MVEGTSSQVYVSVLITEASGLKGLGGGGFLEYEIGE